MQKVFTKKIILVIILLVILMIFGILALKKNQNNVNIANINNTNINNEYSQIDRNELQYKNEISVDEIKDETGIEGNSNLYVIETEFDGRRVLNIKAEIQYKAAFAGIIKGKKPSLEELDEILNENYPEKNGIWIDPKIQTKFIELIKSDTKSEYEINSENYLKIKNKKEQNENDVKLEKIINGDKKIIATISKMYYEVDSMTGEIVEYPFEQLDNYQTHDILRNDRDSIIIITSNFNKKLTNKEILQDILCSI